MPEGDGERIIATKIDADLSAPQRSAAARSGQVKHAPRRISHPNATSAGATTMLVRQTDGDMTAAATARIILERWGRHRSVDHFARGSHMILGFGQQARVESNVHAATGGAEPDRSTRNPVTFLPQAQRLKRELYPLWVSGLGPLAQRCSLVFDDGQRAIVGKLDGVATPRYRKPLRANIDRPKTLGSRGLGIVDGSVVGHPLRDLAGIGAFAVHLQPCPARAEGMVRHHADPQGLRNGAHSSVRSPRPKLKATL